MNSDEPDRQLPTRDEVFLDHVGYFIADLQRAGERLQRLGFNVSPINLQQNADTTGALKPSGTSNRIALLRFGFIEILAATHDTPLADQLKHAVARYEGLHLIALSHADIPAQRERLIAAGFPMQEVVRLRRHKQTAEGLREIAWSVLRPQPGAMPEGRVQFAYCHTPEMVWPNDAPPLENGAEALTDILICVANRHEAAARFGRYADREPTEDGDFSIVPVDRGALVFVEPETLAKLMPGIDLPSLPFIAGQALRADIATTRALFSGRDIAPMFAHDRMVCVGPHDALGSALLFHSASVRDPWQALLAQR